MLRAGRSHTDGALAEKIQYDVYEENKVLKEKKRIRVNGKAKLKAIFFIVLVSAMALFVVHRYAEITKLNYLIKDATKSYNAAKNDNMALKVEIDRELDLSRIRETAEKKLKMHKPDRYQIIYMKVANDDFTEVAAAYQDSGKDSKGIFIALKDKIGGIVRLLN